MTVDRKGLSENCQKLASENFSAATRVCRTLRNHELISAEPRQKIIRIHSRPEAVRDHPDQLVADIMAEGIVDVFEPIEVQIIDRDLLLRGCFREDMIEPICK